MSLVLNKISRIPLVTVAAIAAAGVGAGAMAAADDNPVLAAFSLPPTALAAIAVAVCAVPIVLRDWRIGFWAFFVWLPFEDLVRKFAGNDIRVYVVKDLLFLVALLGLAPHLRQATAWRAALGRSRLFLLALLAYAGALAVPTIISGDWRVALIGLRLNFFYVPLIAVGYYIASDVDRLRKTMLRLALLASVVLAFGIIQGIIGPSFLAPKTEVAGLHNLVLERTVRGTYARIYQPTGTFVDPGRFASMGLVGLTLALAAYGLNRGRGRAGTVTLASTLVALVALWQSAARASLIAATVVIIASVIAVRQRRVVRLVAVVGLCMGAGIAVYTAAPAQVADRVDYLSQSLDPRSNVNEWSVRWEGRTSSLLAGVGFGGAFGRGAGTQSLGRQYLYGGETRSLEGLSALESGWGAVAYEYGVIGLLLWWIWTVSWFARMRRGYAATADRGLRLVSAVVIAWIALYLVVGMFTGYQVFQNYVSNAYFWFFSGIVFARYPPRRDDAVEAATPVTSTMPAPQRLASTGA